MVQTAHQPSAEGASAQGGHGLARLYPTRACGGQIDGDPLDLGVKRAKIDVKEETWLPAVENLGEGIFIGFDPEAMRVAQE